jgi:radical SAM superfamily enzyme YgiQ (UPF0313 family)
MKLILTCLPIFNHVFTPPLSLAYLKAYVEQYAGIEVEALDLEPEYFSSSAIKKSAILYWDRIWHQDYGFREKELPLLDEFVDMLLSRNPTAVGFSVAYSNFSSSRYVSQKIKEINPEIYIIYGGRYFCLREPWRFWVAEWHKDFAEVDCIVKNEGEETLREIVEALKKGTKPTFCKGATLRAGDEIVDGGSRSLIEGLDTIPFPDFSDFPKEDYLAGYIRMVFSRGCIGQCVYCVENDTMGTIRYRSPANVIKELKLRLSQGYRKFQLCDLALNSQIKPLLEICNKIVEEKLDVEFVFSEFRNAPHLTPKVFSLLYKAGFRTICFGAESSSQRILDMMGKGVKVETIENNFRDAHNAGLKVILYLMVGFPGETEESFLETIEVLGRNKNFIDGITAIAPTQVCGGSKIHEKPENYDLNTSSLFNCPDTWESNDGKNSFRWRKGLADRMHQYLRDFQIPPVDFSLDGNPQIPALKSRIASPQRLKEYKERLSLHEVLDKSKLKSEYSAVLRIIEKHADTAFHKNIIFVLEVRNTSVKEWKQVDNMDWIRVGCKIYDTQKNSDIPVSELRQDLPKDIKNGEEFQVVFRIINNSFPKGKYRLKFDLVNELQFWFEDLGSLPLVEDIVL